MDKIKIMELLDEEDESYLGDTQFVQSYSQSLAQRIAQNISSEIPVIVDYWVRMGISRTKMDERALEMEEIIRKEVKVCNETERNSMDKLILYNQTKYSEVNDILRHLSLEAFEMPNDLSLLKKAKLLYFEFEQLVKLKNERMETLTKLMSERETLCRCLDREANPFKTVTEIPSELELSKLRDDVKILNNEKDKRSKIFTSKKRQIQDLFRDLGRDRDYSNNFEQMVFDETDKFILSDKNMNKLKNLHCELESEYYNNNQKRIDYQTKLTNLYERLEVAKPHRDKFLTDIGCSKASLIALKTELEKLEEMKKANIKRFTDKIRLELSVWYEKCYALDDDDRKRFAHKLDDNNFTEKLLDDHEKELERLKTFYGECEEMFAKLNEWNEKFAKWCQLENFKWNPNIDRYNNRGGILLKEEKERTNLNNRLTALEGELSKLCRKRVQNGKQEFKVYGTTVADYIAKLRLEFEKTKENEKKQRQKVKETELQSHLKGKKVTPSCVPARRTPVKRALTQISPNCGESGGKLRRIGAPLTPNQLNNNGKATNCPPIAKPRGRNLANQMNQLAKENGSLLSINESDFQAPLCERDNANSTFISVPRNDTPLKQSSNVTNRRQRIPQKQNLNRRKSRSCSDLAETMVASLQIGGPSRVGSREVLPTIRSNPVSPHPKANGFATPNRFPRFAVAQRKPPFVV